jgi:hypothetical protein
MRKEEVQKALNRSLSGLQADPWLAQRIIANEEEKPVKKRYLYHLYLRVFWLL